MARLSGRLVSLELSESLAAGDQAGPAGVLELIYKEDLVERFCDGIERMISQRVN